MDTDLVVQEFAVLVFASVLDIAQQVDPLDRSQVDEYHQRTMALATDVGRWMREMSPEDVAFLCNSQKSDHEYLPFDRWMPVVDGYDATAVCADVQEFIRLLPPHLATATVVNGTGAYLESMDDHKLAWIVERAANVLALNYRFSPEA